MKLEVYSIVISVSKEAIHANSLKATMATQQPKRRITIKKEPVTMANGEIMKPVLVTDSTSAYRATLLMLFQHVAEIHMAILEIMEEKYGHSIEDMLAAVTVHPKWQEMLVNPMVHDLTAECLSRGSSASVTPAATAPSSPTLATAAAPPVAATKKFIVRRRIVRPPQEATPQGQ